MLMLSDYELYQLDWRIGTALMKALSNPKQSEPQLVANLVCELSSTLNGLRLSNSMEIKAGGIFVHANPLVTWKSFTDKSKKSVEIGDLLLIRTLVTNNTVIERQALLLQAKKTDRIESIPDNNNQWHLYEQWPRFSYAERSGKLTGKKRHIKEPDMYDAAKYLMLHTGNHPSPRSSTDNCLQLCCLWHPFLGHYTAQPTPQRLSRLKCFICELVAFIAGNGGKAFSKPESRTRGWNRVVQDLITQTAKAKSIYMGRAKNQMAKLPRMTWGGQSEHFMVVDQSFTEIGGVEERLVYYLHDDIVGVSIIEMVLEQGAPNVLPA